MLRKKTRKNDSSMHVFHIQLDLKHDIPEQHEIKAAIEPEHLFDAVDELFFSRVVDLLRLPCFPPANMPACTP